MSSEEVRDFEKKLRQTFALGQPALVQVVLDAYRSLVDESAYQEGLLLACEAYKPGHELQRHLTLSLMSAYKEIE